MARSHHLGLAVLLGAVAASIACTDDCDASTCEIDCDETYDEDDAALAACYNHCAKCGTAEPDDD